MNTQMTSQGRNVKGVIMVSRGELLKSTECSSRKKKKARRPKRLAILTRALGKILRTGSPKIVKVHSPKDKVQRDIFQILYHSAGQAALCSGLGN